MVQEKFDAIVVGAGLAGTSAALEMAKAGLKVILLERGDFPGSKNVMGGILYRQPLEKLIPGWWRDAPVERPITEQRVWLLTEDSMVTAGYKSQRFSREPYNAFSVLRAKFDRWFAEKAVEAGALLVTQTVAEDVIRQDGQIVGVRTNRPDGDLYGDVVIAADGVNSLLSKQAGLHGELPPHRVALAVKEIIGLSIERINERFGLEEGHGTAIELFGDATEGMLGYGFIYTNKDTLSVGTGALLSDFIERQINPNELLERFKQHPMVRPLLQGGEAKEYMAHLIPEGGAEAIPPLFGDGILVVGDAANLVNALYREGSNLAVVSGKLAGQTVQEAKDKGDFSAHTLSRYHKLLDESFIMQDLRLYGKTSRFFGLNRQFMENYPAIAAEAIHELMTVDSVPKGQKQRKILRRLFQKRPAWQMARDVVGALRALT